MTTATFERALRIFSLRRPFRPFIIELGTGERITVVNPDFVAMFGDMIAYMNAKGRYQLFDASSVNQILDAPE